MQKSLVVLILPTHCLPECGAYLLTGSFLFCCFHIDLKLKIGFIISDVAKIGSICETSKFSIHFFFLRLIHHKARRVTILTFLVFYLVNSRKVRTFVPVNGLFI